VQDHQLKEVMPNLNFFYIYKLHIRKRIETIETKQNKMFVILLYNYSLLLCEVDRNHKST
jgi:hypothetical protein